MRPVIWIAALLSGVISLESGLLAATTIKYLEFPAGTQQGANLNLPLTLNLPCYGKVQVTISPTPPTVTPPSTTFWQQTGAQGGSVTQNQTVYSWGTDTNRFNIFNNGTTDIDYTITFNFNTPPDASRLFLVVAGLATNTTATVSTAPVSPAGSLVGEFTLGGSSTTAITGSVLRSLGNGDPVNTGWALYQPRSTATFTKLSVAMHQRSGDGVGWTLGYICAATPPCGPENPSRCVDPCCPPWNAAMLEDMLIYQGSGGIAAPYTLLFKPTDLFEDQIQAYIDYLHVLDPAFTSIGTIFTLNDAGTGNVPSGGGPQVGKSYFIAWEAGGRGVPIGETDFFTLASESMKINNWYSVNTKVFLNNELTFFPGSCAISQVSVRIQVQRAGKGGRVGSPVLQILMPDGRVVEKGLYEREE